MVVYFEDGFVDERPVGYVPYKAPLGRDRFLGAVFVVDFKASFGNRDKRNAMLRLDGHMGHGDIVGFELDASQELMNEVRDYATIGREPAFTMTPWTSTNVLPWRKVQAGDVVEVDESYDARRFCQYEAGTLIEVADVEIVWKTGRRNTAYNKVYLHGTNGEKVDVEHVRTLVSSPFKFQEWVPSVEA